jgi:hypothetical protein
MRRRLTGTAGALTRIAPKVRSPAQEICSRFALIAGEGARGPSEEHD